MPNLYNLTGDLGDLLGSTSVISTAKAWLETNLNGAEGLIDTGDGGQVRLGGTTVPLDADGSFDVVGLVGSDSTDLNVEAGTLQYQLVVSYRDQRPGGGSGQSTTPRTYRSGWFYLNQNEDIRTVAKSASPAVVATGAEIIAAASAEADRAEAAAESASATTDAQVATLATTDGTETHTALSATFVAVFNVKAYGALGDGVTNDRQAFVDALAAAAAQPGSVVRVPAGTYIKAGDPIPIPSEVTLMGDGMGVSIIKNADGATAGQSVLTNSDTVSGNTRLGVRELTCDANLAASSGAIHVIYMDNLTDCYFDNLEVTGGRNDGVTAGSGSGFQPNRMTRSRVGYIYAHHNMYDGVLFGGCTFNTIDTVHGVDNSRSAFQLSRYPIGSGAAGSDHNTIGTVIAQHSTGDPDINGASTAPTTSGLYFHYSSYNTCARIMSHGCRQGVGIIENAHGNVVSGGVVRHRDNAEDRKAALEIETSAGLNYDNVFANINVIGLEGGLLSEYFRVYGIRTKLVNCNFSRGEGTSTWYGFISGGSNNAVIGCAGDGSFQDAGSKTLFVGPGWGALGEGNYSFGLPNYGSGAGIGVWAMKNAATVPSGNPSGGGFLYVEAGALKYRGSSGTVTTIGPA